MQLYLFSGPCLFKRWVSVSTVEFASGGSATNLAPNLVFFKLDILPQSGVSALPGNHGAAAGLSGRGRFVW